jgi:hypothetical protein
VEGRDEGRENGEKERGSQSVKKGSVGHFDPIQISLFTRLVKPGRVFSVPAHVPDRVRSRLVIHLGRVREPPGRNGHTGMRTAIRERAPYAGDILPVPHPRRRRRTRPLSRHRPRYRASRRAASPICLFRTTVGRMGRRSERSKPCCDDGTGGKVIIYYFVYLYVKGREREGAHVG